MSKRGAQGLGSNRWNQNSDTIVDWGLATSDMLYEGLLVDGTPPGTNVATPFQEYKNLVAMANAGDPEFWSDMSAKQRLYELSTQFGQPGAQAQPLGPDTSLVPRTIVSATPT